MTWDDFESIAFGKLGQTKKEFYKSTLREFNNRLRGYYQNLEYHYQRDWERVRWQTYYLSLMTGNYPKGKAPKKPQDILKFTWEEARKEVKILSEEERRKIVEANHKRFGKWLDGKFSESDSKNRG